MGVLLALVASAAWGASGFFGGVLAKRSPAALVVAFAQVAGLLTAGIILAVRADSQWSLAGAAYGLVAGAVNWVALASLYGGLASGAMGVVAPLSALAPIVPLGFGLARGENPTPL